MSNDNFTITPASNKDLVIGVGTPGAPTGNNAVQLALASAPEPPKQPSYKHELASIGTLRKNQQR